MSISTMVAIRVATHTTRGRWRRLPCTQIKGAAVRQQTNRVQNDLRKAGRFSAFLKSGRIAINLALPCSAPSPRAFPEQLRARSLLKFISSLGEAPLLTLIDVRVKQLGGIGRRSARSENQRRERSGQIFLPRWVRRNSTGVRVIFRQHIAGRKGRVSYRHNCAGGTTQDFDLGVQLLCECLDDAGAKASLCLP